MAEQAVHNYKFYTSKGRSGYIIYTPEHYQEFISDYSTGFLDATRETAQGGTGRYLSASKSLITNTSNVS
nr:MAG TPA: Guanyl-specific ribonuclease Sa [Caudoviricetes sp.]